MSIDITKIAPPIREKQTKKGRSAVMEFLSKDIKLGGSGLAEKKKEKYYNQLGILLQSGIDIKTSLEIIREQQKKKKEQDFYYGIEKKVVGGLSLSEAMHSTGKFTLYEYYSLKIGEESGKLPHVLQELAIFFNKKIKLKRQVVSALSYPVLVMVVAVGAIIFMMNVIVPMFEDVFKRFGGKLPNLTKNIIELSAFFSEYLYVIFIVFLLIVLAILSQRKKQWFRRVSSSLMIRLPLFGSIIKQVYQVRFCQSMTLLISSKTSLIRAIELVRDMIGFYPFEVALNSVAADLLNGKSLHLSMAKFNVFDIQIIALVKVAEEVNKLENIFNSLNKQISEELEHRIGMMSNLLEPFLIVFVGVLVAIILIAMYMPLFQLSTSVYQ